LLIVEVMQLQERLSAKRSEQVQTTLHTTVWWPLGEA
jgi:hypothetical protein